MRLFFALWPDAPARMALATLANELALHSGGKAVPPAKIHLTLAFLGDVDDGRLEQATQAPGTGRRPPFDVRLDTVGSFRGARVAWAGCRKPASGLSELQSALAHALAERGFALDERPYTPHVTLVRKIARPIAQGSSPPIAWRATELALVRSEPGRGSYATLAAWPLA